MRISSWPREHRDSKCVDESTFEELAQTHEYMKTHFTEKVRARKGEGQACTLSREGCRGLRTCGHHGEDEVEAHHLVECMSSSCSTRCVFGCVRVCGYESTLACMLTCMYPLAGVYPGVGVGVCGVASVGVWIRVDGRDQGQCRMTMSEAASNRGCKSGKGNEAPPCSPRGRTGTCVWVVSGGSVCRR